MPHICSLGQKVLKDDPNELYRAASKAQEMADYIEKNMLLKGLDSAKALENGRELLSKRLKNRQRYRRFKRDCGSSNGEKLAATETKIASFNKG